nr:MAG TPA: major capsid protein [Caudoviricetes sp.]
MKKQPFWMTRTAKNKNDMTREIVVDEIQVHDDSRTMTLSFASETPYERWFGPEVLCVDETAMNMQRFQDGLGCLLFNHDRDKVIGKIERAWLEDNRAYAEVTFDDDEFADSIFNKVKSGTLKGVSVGYRVGEYTDVHIDESFAQGRIKGPCYVASKWEPYEISIVSVPADTTVGVNRSLNDFNVVSIVQEEEISEMGEKQNQNNEVGTDQQRHGETPSATPVAGTEVPQDNARGAEEVIRAIEEERARVSNISELCRHFGVNATDYINNGVSLAEAQRSVLAIVEERKAPKANLEMGQQEEDKYRDAMSDAILLRGGVQLENVAPGAQELRGMRVRSMFEEVLAREGVANTHRMGEEELLRAALTGTSSLPGILSAAANKSMAKGYQAAQTTFEQFTTVGSNTDFKEATRYRLSEAGSLFEIKENGEFVQDELTEGSAKTKVLTYGRGFSFTRQMIVNDDLSALTRIPSLYAAQAKRGINRLVYKALAEAKFTAKDGNLAATGAALSLATIDEARQAMRKQKNLRGEEFLNITPKYLIVPTKSEFLARQLLTSTSDPNATHYGVTNPLMGSLQIITDAELDALDTDAYYFLADQMLMDTIEVTYLNGNQRPVIESQVAFDTLGIRYRIYMDYGVTVVDTKGIYKNAGK